MSVLTIGILGIAGALRAVELKGLKGEYGIYLASESFDAQEWKKLADRCHEAGVRCYLMMPRIFRRGGAVF